MEDLISKLDSILVVIGAVVVGCTAIVAGLEKIASITPSTKDDEYVGKLKKALGVVSGLLDYFSVYRTKDKK